MLNLISISNYTLSSIILDYFLVIIISIATAFILRLPLIPSRPIRYSFDVSILYPTPLIAVGVFTIFFILGFSGILISIIIGICTALFVKYLFYYLFPKPKEVS